MYKFYSYLKMHTNKIMHVLVKKFRINKKADTCASVPNVNEQIVNLEMIKK